MIPGTRTAPVTRRASNHKPAGKEDAVKWLTPRGTAPERRPTARARRCVEARDRRRPLLPVAPRPGPTIDSGAAGATEAGAATVVAPGAVLCAATGYGKAAAGAGMTTARPMMWACPAKASVVI
jgi:hypothetical protein